MDNKLLLAKGITLLFRESQIKGIREKSTALVRELINAIKLPEVNVGVDHERDILQGLKTTALAMCDMPEDHSFEAMEILQRVKINTGEDTELYEAIRSGIETELSDEKVRRACVSMRKMLMNHFREQKINEIISKASYRIRFERDKIENINQFVAEVCALLEPYQVDAAKNDPAVISDVSMGDLEAVKGIFQSVKDQVTGATILRTGLQGLNDMLDGGFRRGEEWVFGGLQHNYKTGFSLTVFKQLALYNKPVLKDPTKKALMLRISCEDSLAMNFQFLYQSIYESETGQKAVVEGLSVEEMSNYVTEKLSVNGYHTHFMHVNPSLWTYRSIINKVLELEAQGYEIHVVMVDYLLKIPTTGCDQGPAGVDIRNMYERLRGFFNAREILFITPHQLSTDAKQLIRDGRQGFVKELVGRGYYAGCKQLDQVVDGELFIHIEYVNGVAYLTVQRGKHRKDQIRLTPREHLFYAWAFAQTGGIPDDLGKANTARRKVGGGPVGTSEETPFWDIKEEF